MKINIRTRSCSDRTRYVLQARPTISSKSTGYKLSSILFQLLFTINHGVVCYSIGLQWIMPPSDHAPLQCNLATPSINQGWSCDLLWSILENWCCETFKASPKRFCSFHSDPLGPVKKPRLNHWMRDHVEKARHAANSQNCMGVHFSPTAPAKRPSNCTSRSEPTQDQQNSPVNPKNSEK